ncbi:MAG: 3-keto-5-aminohexanoate cleavage protein [Proteobacteria bacterium]|nr:3-keto-5-aminohexanoate cleavage protein [Pseudomonadota bacterium]
MLDENFSQKLIINLCPTGMVPQKKNCPFVPISATEIAKDVQRCHNLGVSMVHLHARLTDGTPTWEKAYFEEIINEILIRINDIILVVTTSGRNWPEIERRSNSLECLPTPDMASLTLGSMNFPKEPSINSPDTIIRLAEIMNEKGIVPELEVFDIGMVNFSNYLINKNILNPPFYYNLILGNRGTADLSPINIAALLSTLPHGATWALGGIGRYQLAANSLALSLGGHVRVGLEDNPYYDWSKKTDASNPVLVERIVNQARLLGREIANVEDARRIIGLPQRKQEAKEVA